jgi:hypothetical protein
MMPIATLFVGTGLMFNVAATVPTYNVKPTCRAAIDLAGVTGRTAEMCEPSPWRYRQGLADVFRNGQSSLPTNQRTTNAELCRACGLP